MDELIRYWKWSKQDQGHNKVSFFLFSLIASFLFEVHLKGITDVEMSK